jgi:hypothetical protein
VERNEAKQYPFRFVFSCLSENKGPIFSLCFASIFHLVSLPQRKFSFEIFCVLSSVYTSVLRSRSRKESHHLGRIEGGPGDAALKATALMTTSPMATAPIDMALLATAPMVTAPNLIYTTT